MYLLNARLARGKKSADIARAIGIKPQKNAQVFDLKHSTKIDTIAAALAAMGYDLELKVAAVKA